MPEDKGKQNQSESYTNEYQKHVACSYGYNIVCVDNKFSKRFKSYLGENAVYNSINSMVEESKYCSDVMKKHFTNSCCICDNDCVIGDNKVRDHYPVTGKYGSSAHRQCIIKVKLNCIKG